MAKQVKDETVFDAHKEGVDAHKEGVTSSRVTVAPVVPTVTPSGTATPGATTVTPSGTGVDAHKGIVTAVEPASPKHAPVARGASDADVQELVAACRALCGVASRRMSSSDPALVRANAAVAKFA